MQRLPGREHIDARRVETGCLGATVDTVEPREASERLLSGLAHLEVGFDAEHRVAELPGEKRVTRFIEEAGQLTAVLPNRD